VQQHAQALDVAFSLLATSGDPQQRVNAQSRLSCTYDQPQRVDHRMKIEDLRGSFEGSFDGHHHLRPLGAQIALVTVPYREFAI
jgi:hypothetical protein